VLVVVAVVLGVPVTVVHVVDVVVVLEGLVPAIRTVGVVVRARHDVDVVEVALVVVTVVRGVDVAVVQVVDVPLVLDGEVAAVGAVDVGVLDVAGAGRAHGAAFGVGSCWSLR
jgi:hypothetical protein